MRIKFSRHAKRRRELYKIPEEIVRKVIKGKELIQGRQEIIEYVPKLKYPLKIVVSVKGDEVTVITNYPLKRGRKDEGLL